MPTLLMLPIQSALYTHHCNNTPPGAGWRCYDYSDDGSGVVLLHYARFITVSGVLFSKIQDNMFNESKGGGPGSRLLMINSSCFGEKASVQYSGNTLDCWSTGRTIDPAPGA